MISGVPVAAIDLELASRIAAKRPRIVAICAPAGSGKDALLRALAGHLGELVVCELWRGARDLARPVLDALVTGDRRREALTAATRLAQRSGTTTARDSLRREWERTDAVPRLVALRDADGALATADGIELAGELVATLPPGRVLALVTNDALPRALETLLANAGSTIVRAEALALSDDGVRALALATGVDFAVARRLARVAGGRAGVTLLLLGLARRGDAARVEDDATGLTDDELLAFAVARTVAALDEPARELLVAAVVRTGSTRASLAGMLGDRYDEAVARRVLWLPFVRTSGETFEVHPAAAAIVRARFAPVVRSVYDRTLSLLTADGAYAEAARVALAAGNAERAVALLDATPPYTSARRVTLSEYERVLDAIDRELVTSYPNVWLSTIPFRRFAVDRMTYIREAETVFFCLPRSSPPEQRAAVLTHLASAYLNVGRIDACERLVDEALGGFARDDAFARASLLNFRAILRGFEGRFTEAHELAERASELAPNAFGENLALHHIDANEAAMRGDYGRAAVIVDEITRRHRRDDLPLYLAYAVMNGAVFAWMSGEEDAFERYIALLEDALTPGIERGFLPMIEAARGRAPRLDDEYPWPIVGAIAQLYRLGNASTQAEALDAARAAARFADLRRDTLAQVLAHVAVGVLDPASRPAEKKALRALIEQVESPELHAAVERVLAGEPGGMLDTFVRRRVLRERDERKTAVAVELFSGRVSRDQTEVRLRDKELELLALLATSPGWVSRDRIGEALWDHLDPGEWSNNLKVTLSRVRSKLGDRDAVVINESGYRLSPMIDVDLRRAEALVREIAGSTALGEETRAALERVVGAYAAGGVTRLERFTWSGPILVRIADAACTAGLALADDAVRRTDFAGALAYASIVVELDPYSERAAELRMRASLTSGDVDGARREFRRYASALAEELGVAPSPRLAELAGVRP